MAEQREQLAGYKRQCVHALARLYLARYRASGKDEALLLLRTYWQQVKTDEDALRPPMELLGEQERYQEAETYYQQCLAALTEEATASSRICSQILALHQRRIGPLDNKKSFLQQGYRFLKQWTKSVR